MASIAYHVAARFRAIERVVLSAIMTISWQPVAVRRERRREPSPSP